MQSKIEMIPRHSMGNVLVLSSTQLTIIPPIGLSFRVHESGEYYPRTQNPSDFHCQVVLRPPQFLRASDLAPQRLEKDLFRCRAASYRGRGNDLWPHKVISASA